MYNVNVNFHRGSALHVLYARMYKVLGIFLVQFALTDVSALSYYPANTCLFTVNQYGA